MRPRYYREQTMLLVVKYINIIDGEIICLNFMRFRCYTGENSRKQHRIMVNVVCVYVSIYAYE